MLNSTTEAAFQILEYQIKELIEEIKTLNVHLDDIKKMVAPALGFKVIKDKE